MNEPVRRRLNGWMRGGVPDGVVTGRMAVVRFLRRFGNAADEAGDRAAWATSIGYKMWWSHPPPDGAVHNLWCVAESSPGITPL